MAILQDTDNLMLVYAMTRQEFIALPQYTSRLLQEVPFDLIDEMEQLHLDVQTMRDRLLATQDRICESFGHNVMQIPVRHERPQKRFSINDRIEQMIDNDQIDRIPDQLLQQYEQQFLVR